MMLSFAFCEIDLTRSNPHASPAHMGSVIDGPDSADARGIEAPSLDDNDGRARTCLRAVDPPPGIRTIVSSRGRSVVVMDFVIVKP